MYNVALTGNVAAGKSMVTSLFARWGATVVDADQIVRELQAPGQPVFNAIVDRFGHAMVAADGSLDRARLRTVVMADPEARTALNRIVHPSVQRRRGERLRLAEENGDCVIVSDIPLLFEVLDADDFDYVVLVDAPVAVRRERLIASRSLTPAEADRLIAAQMDSAPKRARSDVVIDNAGSVEELERAAWNAWRTIRTHAARHEGGRGRLVAVFAHPDDESISMGGTLARYADAGIELHVVSATTGDAGTQHQQKPGVDVGERRRLDFERAADALGVQSARILDYADGTLDRGDRSGIRAIAEILERLRPDVIVTFGPEGVTGHRDHVAVHEWTTTAWQESDHGRLFYVDYPRSIAEHLPGVKGGNDERIAAIIDVRPWADVKRAAILAHQTQHLPFDLDAPSIRPIFEREWYAATGPRQTVQHSLFAASKRA